jgi:DNA-binding transcriptional MerR regulator/DNA gyrase inhibitor GyrI
MLVRKRAIPMFSIGEFSKISGLPMRTLRFYHERGLLVPAAVDVETGYRSYDERNLDVARVIVALRGLEFSLEEIAEMLAGAADDADILDHLERQKQSLSERLRKYKNAVQQIEHIVDQERTSREVEKMKTASLEVEERNVEPILVAGVRMKGRYRDMGQGFAALGKRIGRHIAGKPLCLYYDGEYREDDADFEPCMPIRKPVDADGVTVRELPGGRCVTLMHEGPYEGLSRSYARIMKYAKEHGYEIELPTREVYHKGPGMIFRGNPKKYLTEIQLPVARNPP